MYTEALLGIRLADLGNAGPVELMYMLYEDPVLYRLGVVRNFCDPTDVPRCIESGYATVMRYAKRVGVRRVEKCHSYMSYRATCLERDGLFYDGHLLYTVRSGEVVLLNHKYIFELSLEASSSNYIRYSTVLNPAFFSSALFGRGYAVFYVPGEGGVRYTFVTSSGRWSKASIIPELHREVVEAVANEMAVFYEKGPLEWRRFLSSSRFL
jgi:hypothetical protein